DDKTLVEFPGGKTKAEVDWTVELPEGEHRLNVMASSPDSVGYSSVEAVKFRDLAKLPILHVMAVGINDYQNNTLELKYAVPDAKALPQAFEKHCKGQTF